MKTAEGGVSHQQLKHLSGKWKNRNKILPEGIQKFLLFISQKTVTATAAKAMVSQDKARMHSSLQNYVIIQRRIQCL